MDDLDRPKRLQLVYEELEVQLHDIDKRYWESLKKLQAPLSSLLGSPISPPPPKLPGQLHGALHAYARSLFFAEARGYPRRPRLGHWLSKLAERTTERVLDRVERLERAGLFSQSLVHHGVTRNEMRQSVGQSLLEFAHDCLKQEPPFDATPPAIQATSAVEEEGPRYTSLPGAMIYGVCADRSTEFVAWDGYGYVLRPTKESVWADDSLRLIGSVRDLAVDEGWVPSQGQVGVIRTAPPEMPTTPSPESTDIAQVDPQNWSPLRQKFEAYRSIRKLVSQPHERVSESLVRDTIAEQLGIKPEEVTSQQIRREVATSLLSDFPAIKLVTSQSISGSVSEQDSLLKTESAPRRGQRKAKLRKRDAVIFAAILKELTGVHYCSFLQEHGLKPKWSDSEHASYPKSYRAGDPWRKKVQDEKTRANTRMDRYTFSEIAVAFNAHLPDQLDPLSQLLSTRATRATRVKSRPLGSA